MTDVLYHAMVPIKTERHENGIYVSNHLVPGQYQEKQSCRMEGQSWRFIQARVGGKLQVCVRDTR